MGDLVTSHCSIELRFNAEVEVLIRSRFMYLFSVVRPIDRLLGNRASELPQRQPQRAAPLHLKTNSEANSHQRSVDRRAKREDRRSPRIPLHEVSFPLSLSILMTSTSMIQFCSYCFCGSRRSAALESPTWRPNLAKRRRSSRC